MPTLCKPAVMVPEHVITFEDTLDIAHKLHSHRDDYALVKRLICNTRVKKRHLVQDIETTLRHPGFEKRNLVYIQEAKKRIPEVVQQALSNADLGPAEIDAIIYVSCTGFTMPSPTAWMINNLGFRTDVCQIPIAQLGCAAGGAAINRAHDYCLAHPRANVLLVACEFCSLCYQPTDLTVGNLLSNGLFGDAVAASVMRGSGGFGVSIIANSSRLVPGTEDWISYAVKETGFHFCLDRRVPGTMEQLAPELREVARLYNFDSSSLDFYIIHAGGPRILDDLSRFLKVDARKFAFSRQTLSEYGNIASAVVLDALKRLFESGTASSGDVGIIAGFGPGITAEISLGSWSVAT